MSIPSPMQLSEPAITVVNSTHASPTTDGWINTRGLVSFERATAHRRHSASSDADGLPLSQTSSLSHRTMARTTSGVRPSTTLSSQSSFHPDDVNASSTEKPFRTSFEDPHAGLVSLESNQTPNSMPSGQRCSPPRSQRDSANCSQVLETTLAKKSTTRKGYRKVNQYRLVDLLGSGAFSEVYLALDTDNKAFAIKVLDRHRLAKLHALTMERSKIEDKILLEIAVLKRLRHPNIIALHEVINDPESKELYLVLEFAMCGPIMLLDDAGNVRPDENNQVRLPEAEAARIVKALINAIRYAHYCGVAHRDIKPQNVLLSEHNEVKLADFGVSEMIEDMYGASAPATTTTPSVTPSTLLGSPNQQPFEADPLVDDDVDVAADDDFTDVLRSHKLKFRPEGTVCFMAPEFLDATKHKEGDEVEMADLYAADIWSLGVTVYTMTIGELPWKANQAATLLEAIRSHPDLPFPSDCPASPLLRDFVRCCIRVNPGERVPLKMLAHHPWITGRGGSFTGGSNSSMGSSFAPRSLSAQDPDQVFRNFSFDAKSMPWAPNNSTSYNANNPNSSSYNMNNKSVLGLSVSFQEPPVCVSPSEVQNAITWRRQPSNASLDASRRGGDDNASMDTSSPLSGYPCPPAHLAGPRHLNYNTLHTTSPSGYMWHSPSSRQPSAVNLGAPRIQLDPLDITATVKADDEADYEDLSPPALVTSSHVTTPSAQSNVFSSCAVTPQGVSIGPIALPTHPPLSTTEEEEEAVDADDDLAAVRRAFEEAVAEATRRPVRPMDPTDVTTSPAVDPKLMNMTSPRDPLSLSNTLMFTSRDAVPSSCLFSPTPVIPYASPPPASVEPPPLLE